MNVAKLGVLVVGLLVFGSYALAQGEVTTIAAASVVIQRQVTDTGAVGTVDWTHQKITVTSYGMPKEGVINPGQMELTARKAAWAEAYNEAAAFIAGLNVTSHTTVRDSRLLDSVTDVRVAAFLKGGRIVEEKWDKEKEVYAVTLGFDMAGAGGKSLLGAVVPRLDDIEKELKAKQPEKQQEPAPTVLETPPATGEALPAPKPGPHTGLIIDLRGYGARPAMSPKIVRPDGSEVWGTLQTVGRDYAIEHGIVGYLPSVETAMGYDERVGDNPLIVRAVGVQGAVQANAVVSAADAALIAAANQESANHFLDNCRVAFVIEREL